MLFCFNVFSHIDTFFLPLVNECANQLISFHRKFISHSMIVIVLIFYFCLSVVAAAMGEQKM